MASGNANPRDVRSGQTFSTDSGPATGTMPMNTLSATSVTVEPGFYGGTSLNAVDTDLAAANIKSGANLFGVVGNVVQASGTATTAQVLSGQTFSNASGAAIGTMPTQTLIATSATVNAGYYAATTLSAVDADLTAANIKSGVDIFGVSGSAPAPSGSATTAQVLNGKTFSSASGAATGEMPDKGAVTIAPGIADKSIPAGYHNGSGKVAGDADLTAANIKSGVDIFGTTGTMHSVSDHYQPIDDSGTVTANGQYIRDTVTGLVWQRCSVGQTWNATGQTCSESARTFNWDNAKLQTAPGGFRLPTIAELRLLVYCSSGTPVTLGMIFDSQTCTGAFDSPTIVSWAFPQTPSSSVWSGSPSANYSNYAWDVYFGVGYAYNNSRSDFNHVRLVRGGQ